jgi:TetR/AcrR family transcriptional regulator, lmrAB and yxaGH operons repressor
MSKKTDLKLSVISTTERLVRLQGASATGLAQIISESGAPKGSFYFYFPGGKEELLRTMLDTYVQRGVQAISYASRQASHDPCKFIEQLCAIFAREMEETEFQLGCALEAMIVEFAGTNGPWSLQLASDVALWKSTIEHAFKDCGVESDQISKLAVALLAGLQGARILAKVSRSSTPFYSVANHFIARFDPSKVA